MKITMQTVFLLLIVAVHMDMYMTVASRVQIMHPKSPSKDVLIFDHDNEYNLPQKNSGPSRGGEGHLAPNEYNFPQKNSGPSRGGEGHLAPNEYNLPQKNSGPSPGGKGHLAPSSLGWS
ncbi:hypothetical protein L1887_37357 [Cichorium endivia]|nr:hypothetical protein L1887_37357 [Cichorium endivia]